MKWKRWRLFHYRELASTNDTARELPGWSVVLADRQTAGRGRHGRPWHSSEGGLWCSLVLPTPGSADHWRALPLAVGLAVIHTLDSYHVRARMRWPNDIMVEDRKLAGLLLERFHPDHVVAGIGLNLVNDPASEDTELLGIATRLAAHTPSVPGRDAFLCLLLDSMAKIQERMKDSGITDLVEEINAMWGPLPRSVTLHRGNELITGDFSGITDSGDLILLDAENKTSIFPASQISQLTETQNPPSS
ncbi:MAG: biotin--[acetyl-CoA-carboxylase] ligase [Candidatus Methylacidiphilales bacterium]